MNRVSSRAKYPQLEYMDYLVYPAVIPTQVSDLTIENVLPLSVVVVINNKTRTLLPTEHMFPHTKTSFFQFNNKNY